MNVATHIRRARRAKKLNKAELARRLGVARSTITAWEKGGPGPRLDDLPKIARELEVSVGSLIGEREREGKS